MGQRAANPNEMSVELGKQIAHAMIDAGIANYTELAELTGISRPTIGRIVGGTRAANIPEYTAICKALGKSFSELVVAAENAIEAREEN
jgi:transcriptional regulator with XRE-family HTH domain